jgi:hypothetical protein
MRLATILILTLLGFLSPLSYGAGLPSGCSINNIVIKKPNFRYSGDYAYVTGILNQSCKGAIGVELKWTAFYKDGSVAFSQTFWPNSISNIPANTDFPFEFMNSSKIPPASYTIIVNGARIW